jgi:dienelactone hydrolase
MIVPSPTLLVQHGPMNQPQRAPSGNLSSYRKLRFSHDGMSHDVYRKGSGPAVLVLTEMPGISPQVLGFADRVVTLGCSAIVPDLFGIAGRDPYAGSAGSRTWYGLRSLSQVCISREFNLFASGRTSPIVHWLRGLAALEHERCGGPGVGVVGMCFSGGFALAMAVDERVLAPVLSQPSLPLPIGARRRAAIGCDARDLDVVARRCSAHGLRVLGLRFEGDPYVPRERFAFLRERLGDGFVAVTLAQADGHPEGPMPKRHSVLTGDLIDAPGEPTRAALDQVLELFRNKLLRA